MRIPMVLSPTWRPSYESSIPLPSQSVNSCIANENHGPAFKPLNGDRSHVASHTTSVNANAKRAAWRGLRLTEVFVLVLATCMGLVIALVVTLPLDLGDGSGMILTTLTSMAIVFVLTPPLISRRKEGGMVVFDV